MRSTSVIEALDVIFIMMDYPKRIITVNGTSLVSNKVKNFLTARKSSWRRLRCIPETKRLVGRFYIVLWIS